MNKDVKYLGGSLLIALAVVLTIHVTIILLIGSEEYNKIKGSVNILGVLIGIAAGHIAAKMRNNDE